jgi:tetratricopeptide (TPR) repeat protein
LRIKIVHKEIFMRATRWAIATFVVTGLTFVAATGASQTRRAATGGGEGLGNAHIPTSCNDAAQKEFDRGLAMLHSFWYEKAEGSFGQVLVADPGCAIAHWGVAMTLYHQLWEPHVPGDGLVRGAAEIRKAKELEAKTDLEKDLISALDVFYRDANRIDHRTRVVAYEREMAHVHQAHPNDREVTAFYALAMIATAQNTLPADLTYAKEKAAGKLLKEIIAEEPNHPGGTHYLIHAYDDPEMAPQALTAARTYAKIAPSIPHALHMPGHIFTRLGYWQEDIDANLASETAAREDAGMGGMGEARQEELHSMDYLMYAYLQSGRVDEARGVLDQLNAMDYTTTSPAFGIGYAITAMPARYVMEQHKWPEAAKLEPQSKFGAALEAMTTWARAVGAARSGDTGQARASIERLGVLQEQLKKNDPYWAEQVEIQRLGASAWLAHAEGSQEKAVSLMKSAADREDATQKLPVTPGAILPQREQYADLLLYLGQPSKAVSEYETALKISPNRFNALYGAAKAAMAAGNPAQASAYYKKLIASCGQTASGRPELLEAKAFLRGN